MLVTELESNETNIKNTLAHDSLRRVPDIIDFIRMLNSFETNLTIALDAPWGTGKTFFIKQIIFLLKNANTYLTEKPDELALSIYSRYGNNMLQKESAKYLPIYYDSWKHDNDTDPILSLLYEITKQFKYESITPDTDVGKIIFSIFDFCSGRNSSAMYEAFKNKKDLFESFRKDELIHKSFEELFTKIRAEKADKIVIFIDELDRCKPSFAVTLLERIKHYLNIDCISFVSAVNNEQLQHTIKQFYGADFDSIRYLDRFFDFQLKLPKTQNIEGYIHNLIDNGLYDTFYKTIKETIVFLDLTLREIPKYIITCNGLLQNKALLTESYNRNENLLRFFCFNFLIPFVIGLRIFKNDEYIKFVNGNNLELYLNFINSTSDLRELIDEYYNIDINTNPRIEVDSTFDIAKYVYNNLFKRNKKAINNKIQLCFSEKNINIILDAINFSLPEIREE